MDKKKLSLAKKFDTFIFDWDGTLTNIKMLNKMNEIVNPHWRNYKRKSKEKIGKSNVNEVMNDINLKKQINRKAWENGLLVFFVDLSLTLDRPKLHYDAAEVLQSLKRRGKKIALLTNGSPYRILKELSALKVEAYFDVIVSAQQLKVLKPNPLGLEVILKTLGAKRNKAVYIGDMVDDVIMAKYANVQSCAMTDGFDSYFRLKSENPDYIFRSMEEFKKAL